YYGHNLMKFFERVKQTKQNQTVFQSSASANETGKSSSGALTAELKSIFSGSTKAKAGLWNSSTWTPPKNRCS
ncbi:MAG: hypothetical protein WAJ95_18970, partial [Desulfobacterales bacterium]